MLRVLQVVTRLAARGASRHVLELACRLDRERFDVEILAGTEEPGEGSLWAEAERRGVRTIRVRSLRRAPSPADDVRAFLGIRRQMRRTRYDIVHTHISKAGVLGRLAARSVGVPAIVHTYHGPVRELEAGGAVARGALALERLAARCSHLLIAVSGSVAAYLERMHIGRPGKYRVVSNGVDLAHFGRDPGLPCPGEVTGSPVIGAVGSLTVEKGLDILLAALPAVRAAHPGLQLVLVGDGPLRPDLENQARRLGLGEAVTFVGVVEDVRPWLSSLDVLVMPSRSEGMPQVLLESMAMGVPVVASQVGGIPEVLEDGRTGWLVEPGDAGALASRLARALGATGLRQQVAGEGAREVSRRFSLDATVARVGELYEEVVRGRHVAEGAAGRTAACG